ncbi:hypothetical protein [Streptomyces sp. DW26H14]|uniref:hypothetical protein n=1 Tax=Streptomyces sp. DW26H14 TaxID=3435395 RepID=UPI00403DC589
MTERSFLSASAGPVVFGLSLPVGRAQVHINDRLTTARVTLHTNDSTGPAADAIHRARSMQNGQAFGIEVPEMPGNVTVLGGGGTQVFQSVGTVYGSMTGAHP